MKIIIPEIPEDGLDLEIREFVESENIYSPVKANFRIEKVGTEVIVKGDLIVDIKLNCSRCLKDFNIMMSIPVDVVYHPIQELKGEERHEIKNEELDMDFYSGDELDLLVLMREQIELNLPMKPLCSEICKGICPKCGADRNLDICSCPVDEIDPRFEALRGLLDREIE